MSSMPDMPVRETPQDSDSTPYVLNHKAVNRAYIGIIGGNTKDKSTEPMMQELLVLGQAHRILDPAHGMSIQDLCVPISDAIPSVINQLFLPQRGDTQERADIFERNMAVFVNVLDYLADTQQRMPLRILFHAYGKDNTLFFDWITAIEGEFRRHYLNGYLKRQVSFTQALVNSRYWTIFPDDLMAAANTMQSYGDWRQDYIKIATDRKSKRLSVVPDDTLSAPTTVMNSIAMEQLKSLITQAHVSGDIKPLHQAIAQFSQAGISLKDNALHDMGVVLKQLSNPFEPVKQFVNTAKAGTYPATPAPKKPKSFMDRVASVFTREATVEQSNITDAHSNVKDALGASIDTINQAVSSLYALNRRGLDQGRISQGNMAVLREWLETDDGLLMEQDNPILYDEISATANELERSSQVLGLMQHETLSTYRRVGAIREALLAARNGSDILMITEIGKIMVEAEGVVTQFQGGLEKMASIAAGNTLMTALNGTLIRGSTNYSAEALAAPAHETHATVSGYKERLVTTGNPTTPLKPVQS